MPPWGRDAHLRRYRQIAEVLARHGLAYLVGVLGLRRFAPSHPPIDGAAATPTPPEHVRIVLEELGTTFVKLGQLLSTRADLLPPEYQAELAKLQDAAPSIPVDMVRGVIAEELGAPPEAIFATFDPVPLAAASIGQVHAATLHDGTEVVIKVRRPGVVEQVAEDLEILQNLALAASQRWDLAQEYDVVGLAREFADTLREELDYVREGQNAERIAESFAGNPSVHIPRVFWETSTSRVLTLERLRGIKIGDLAALDAAGIDRTALADRVVRMTLEMVFEDAFFHADPHPGNFLIETDGRIGLLDFGMVGRLDDRTQEQLLAVLQAITQRNVDDLVDAFLELGVARRRVHRDVLRRDLERLLNRYYDRPLGELAIGQVIGDALDVIRRHRLQIPANLALLLKMTIMCEGLAVQLDPSFRLTIMLGPYVERLALQQLAPQVLARRLKRLGFDAAQMGTELPHRLRRILGDLERGNLQIGVRPEDFEPLIRRLEQLANRIVLGIILAALIAGLAVLLSTSQLAGLEQWIRALFATGLLVVTALGLYLAWTIVRSGHG